MTEAILSAAEHPGATSSAAAAASRACYFGAMLSPRMGPAGDTDGSEDRSSNGAS